MVNNNQLIMDMEIRFILPGKKLPRVMKVENCKAYVDGFRAVLKKYPDAEFVSFNGHAIRQKV